MPPVFREIPPIDIINQCLKSIGLQDIHDFTLFSKQNINLAKFEEVLPLLEPYYLPCKAEDYLYKSPFTHNHALTILRQVLKIHGVALKYSEKSLHGSKTTFYQLEQSVLTSNKQADDITIAFE